MTTQTWKAQTLRATLFLPEPFVGESLEWLKAMQLPEPDIDENLRKEGIRRLLCILDEFQIELVHQANRIDLHMTPKSPVHFLLEIGSWQERGAEFRSYVRSFLSAVDVPITRLAFGAVFVQGANDRADSYAKLAALVPSVRLDPTNSRDFLYQINRPISEPSSSILMNRLTKWSAIMTARGQLVTSPEGFKNLLTQEYFVRLECDNSTPADNGTPFTKANLFPHFEFLMDLATGNLENGEIA